jgi:hypothetical protein
MQKRPTLHDASQLMIDIQSQQVTLWHFGMHVQGSAADRAGVIQGDEVLAVDGTDVTKVPPFDVATLIAGSRGSASRPGGASDASTSASRSVPSATASATAASPGEVSLLLLGQDGKVKEVTIERGLAREVTNPVKYKLKNAAGQRMGLVALSAFNARAAPELKVQVPPFFSSPPSPTPLLLVLNEWEHGIHATIMHMLTGGLLRSHV